MADVTLTYKGTTIGELSESGNKTLKTAGKYCEDNIELEYVKPSGGGGNNSIEISNYSYEIIRVTAGTNSATNMINAAQYIFGLVDSNYIGFISIVRDNDVSPSPVYNEFGNVFVYGNDTTNASLSSIQQRYRNGWVNTTCSTAYDAKVTEGSVYDIVVLKQNT